MDKNLSSIDEKDSLLKALSKMYPFIYAIRENHYFIGASVFRLCTEEEKRLYSNYEKEFTKIQQLPYQVENCDLKDLSLILKAIQSSPNIDFLDQNKVCAQEKLRSLLEECSDLELANLSNQIEQFKKACNFKDHFMDSELKQ